MNENKLTALLSLLDDPTPEIYKRIENELINLPVSTIPQLEDYWLDSKSTLLQERLEQVINKIQFTHVKNELISWGKTDSQDLIEGAILVNKSYNPNLITDPIRKEIEKIKKDVWLELNDQLTALEKIKILNHFFYNIYNYQALSPNQPTNWDGDIGTVLSQKQGNYIIISIIYAGIAQELGIPVYGINLTDSVLLCYIDKNASNKDEILFYINPIDRGKVFGRSELQFVIESKKIVNRPKYYKATNNSSLIKRLVKHNISVYKKLKLTSHVPNFKELYKSI
ncbi:transglutaminase family protein [Marinifilum sp. D737]|jgi:regulator of sirC expression with transglutaminase-like and TPR domain|uniref:transglutaminase family protein n=1 Tax=Marinifilum sp. D737 TaxID=2969628 RepID=UPI0022767932|nr:transglutaminase family protein [Marinifilum sp. D737]MCY1634736.1 transglutaminase-like domain-containing protein [Marinifilum sp. D737]